MRMVAAAKLRRAQDAIMAARPYSNKLSEILSNLASSVEDDYYHPLLRNPKEVRSIAVVVVSADRGLCGSFNSSVLRAASTRLLREIPKEFPNAKISAIAVGKRAVIHCSRMDIDLIGTFSDVFHKLDFVTAQQILSIVLDGFSEERFDRVEIIGNQFRSIIKQVISVDAILPIGRNKPTEKSGVESDYIFEPSQGEIMDALLPKYLANQVWRSLLDSNAAEQAARMMAMETATTNARDLVNALQLQFNNARQAAITKEMLEIVGGAEALNN